MNAKITGLACWMGGAAAYLFIVINTPEARIDRHGMAEEYPKVLNLFHIRRLHISRAATTLTSKFRFGEVGII